jgi:hypothetical protein
MVTDTKDTIGTHTSTDTSTSTTMGPIAMATTIGSRITATVTIAGRRG